MPSVADAVVVGSGPNGLVAANALVDAGWDVVVLEAQPTTGGAVRSAEVAAPGYRTDLYSAFYPLAAASPVLRGLDLADHGLRWEHAPAVMAHHFPDGRAAVLHRDPDRTAAALEEFGTGDGDAWLTLYDQWRRVRDPLLDAMFTPFPPVRAVARMTRTLRIAGMVEVARFAMLPVRRLGVETFRGDGAPALLTGNALHADIPPVGAGSALFGWLLSMLGQDVGFPVPRGGAGALADAMVARIRARGGEVHTSAPVVAVEVAGNRAAGVRLADGTRIAARRGVLADVDAPTLYRELVGIRHLPDRMVRDLDRFQWDHATLKLNWALSAPVPWRAEGARGAGTVHLGVDVDGFVEFSSALALDRLPTDPFVLFGQMTTADPSRSPAGTESAWAYSHLPHRLADDPAEVTRYAERMTAAVERVAPGFGDLVVGRHVQEPAELHRTDANLPGGALNGGTAHVHQELLFRPTPGLGRAETPIEGLFLASASAHPGGGVHGGCGWNAARAALTKQGPLGAVNRRLAQTAWSRVLGR